MIATIRALTGQQPRALLRRHARPGPRPRARPEGGGAARLPHARRQPEVAGGDHAGTATRAAWRWPRRSITCSATTRRRTSSRTGCTSRLAERVRARPGDAGEFFARSNPWALHAIAERLLEAAQPGHVGRARPGDAGAVARSSICGVDGDLEGRHEAASACPCAIVGRATVALSLQRAGRPGADEDGAAAERGRPGDRRRADPRREGHRQEHAVRALAALLPDSRVVAGCPFRCDPTTRAPIARIAPATERATAMLRAVPRRRPAARRDRGPRARHA